MPTGNGSNAPRVFVDLGCGSGSVLCAALVSQLFSRVVGIDMMKSKALESAYVMRYMKVECDMDTRTIESVTTPNGQQQSGLPAGSITAPGASTLTTSTQVYLGNFLVTDNFDWTADATVVYTCATCYTEDQLAALEILLLRLANDVTGKVVISIDKKLFSMEGDICKGVIFPYQLYGSCQCYTSWGRAVAYIYTSKDRFSS